MAFPRYLIATVLSVLAVTAAGCGGGGGSTLSTSTGTIAGYIYARSRAQSPSDIIISRQAQPPSGATPLNGAVVTLSPGGRTATTATDRSGDAGYFQFAGVAPGSYTATVKASGYTDSTFTAEVLAGSTTLAGVDNGATVLDSTTPVRRKWTFLVYMDAANDLEQYGILNFNQMESVGSTADVNLVVQFKRIAGNDASNGDWTDCRRFLVLKDSDSQQISSPMVQDVGDVDMAKPETLQQFIAWGAAQYPADHYALVLWDHGAGWRSRTLPGGATSRGILFDDASGYYMTMPQLNTGLTVAGVHLDLVAIDACMMSMVESCYEIKDRCDYISAAEGSPPGTGYPYNTIVSKLAANPSMSPEALGRVFVSDMIAAYPNDDVTQTLLQTSRLPALVQKVNDFAGALSAALPADQTQFNTARAATQAYEFTYYRDLYDFANNAKVNIPDAGVSTAATAVMQGLAGADGGPVLAEAHNLSDMRNSHGLSIYLPSPSQLYSGYGDLRFATDYPKWNQLVHEVTGM